MQCDAVGVHLPDAEGNGDTLRMYALDFPDSKGLLKVHRDLGQQPYRISSSKKLPILQRFVEIGLHFFTKAASNIYQYWPQDYVRAKAYLLDADQRPAGGAV